MSKYASFFSIGQSKSLLHQSAPVRWSKDLHSELVSVIKVTQSTKICQCHIKKWKQSSFSKDELGQEQAQVSILHYPSHTSLSCPCVVSGLPAFCFFGRPCLLPVHCACVCLNPGLSLTESFVPNSLNDRENMEREEGCFTKSLTESYKGRNLLQLYSWLLSRHTQMSLRYL